MSSLGSPSPFFLAGKKAYEVERSVRFRGATDQRFDRTLSSTSSSYTVSFWFKGTPVTTNFSRGLFTLGPANNTDVAGVVIGTNDNLIFYGGNGTSSIVTTRALRDISAWYYFTYSVNSNNFTAYINGESFQTGTVRSLDTTSNGFRLGGWWGGYDLFQGYIADFYLIDGSALTPSSFTETNVETGQLIPKKYTGSFGTSGAHLLFDDNSGTTATTLGKDSSGNSNNFTPNNFITGDSVQDSPTNNFPTWNPLSTRSLPTLSAGNLKNASDNNSACNSTFGVTSGKWYWEMHILTDISSSTYIAATGVTSYQMEIEGDSSPALASAGRSYYRGMTSGGVYAYKNYTSTSNTEVSSGGTFYGGTVISFRLDMDNGTLKYYTNNTLVHTDSTIPTDGTVIFPMQNATNSGTTRHNSSIINFGQDGTFAGNKTAQGNADENGIGNFFYAVPSGHKAICSANLSDPTIKLPNKHFNTVLYSGDGNSTRSFSNVLEFQPDWFWTKIRNAAYAHLLYDSVRGAGQLKSLAAQTTGAEGAELDNTTYGYLNSFDANGFSVTKGSASTNFFNESGKDYVTWNWNAGDTDGATYKVVVVSDSGNKYRFRNSADSATFAVSAVELNLAEGGTYIFDQSDSSNTGHPLRFSTTVDGTHGGGSEYTTGVTTAGTPGQSGAYTQIVVAASAPTLNYYCTQHSGMGGQANTNSTKGSTNFDGDATPANEVPTVKVNPSAGFSIVSYKQQTGTYHIGHGLGVAPQLIITKTRSAANSWWTHTTAIDGGIDYGALNLNQQFQDSGAYGIGVPTSLVFEDDTDFTSDNADNIAYLFSSVDGYSKVDRYTGTGESSGPFVFTGFRPAWVLIKCSSSTFNWMIYDSKREPFNLIDKYLMANSASAETGSSTDNPIDFYSNGFKLRYTNTSTNQNGGTYIYLAFAESPFKNARAR